MSARADSLSDVSEDDSEDDTDQDQEEEQQQQKQDFNETNQQESVQDMRIVDEDLKEIERQLGELCFKYQIDISSTSKCWDRFRRNKLWRDIWHD